MLLIFINFIGNRENPEFQTREPFPFLKGVVISFRNRAFVILLIAYLLALAGGAMVAPLTPYMGEYVFRVQNPWLVPAIVLVFLVGAAASVYPWMKLSQKIGKNKTWNIGMAIGAVAGFTAMVVYNEGAWVWWLIISILAGMGYGCTTSIGPSLFADVVDSDELETGRRREGVFFGVMTFVEKAAVGLAVFAGLQGLDLIGYVPNVEQTASVIFGMKFLFCLMPAICHVVAVIVFLLFPITPEVHAQIRAELDKRAVEVVATN
jgi:Na+/melibiose symporter-like transporter